MAHEHEKTKSVNETLAHRTGAHQHTPAQAGRRRMLRRSLGTAAPVIITLASNPVAASTCVVASSFVSALTMASRKPTSAQPCKGTTPSAWCTNSAFASCGVPVTVTFKSLFGGTASTWNVGTNFTKETTLMQALKATVGSNAMLAQYVSAAYMNLMSTRVSANAVNLPALVKVWGDITATGFYRPTAASPVKFNAAQSVTWLAAMMT